MNEEEDYARIEYMVESSKKGILFGLGGLGDFLISLDVCSKNDINLFFWINSCPILATCEQFAKIFKVNCFFYNCEEKLGTGKIDKFLDKVNSQILHGRVLCCYNNMHYDFPKIDFAPYKKNTIFDNLDEYKIKIPSNYFVICPKGSSFHHCERRMFYKKEFEHLVNLGYKKKLIPVIIANDSQLDVYNENQRCQVLQFDKYCQNPINIGNFLYIIYNSTFAISVDTFLKTLTGLMHKTTYMIKNRNEHNNYHEYGVGRWDSVFIDPEKWKFMTTHTFDEIIEIINKYNKIGDKKIKVI
jgi:hypothetical protein